MAEGGDGHRVATHRSAPQPWEDWTSGPAVGGQQQRRAQVPAAPAGLVHRLPPSCSRARPFPLNRPILSPHPHTAHRPSPRAGLQRREQPAVPHRHRGGAPRRCVHGPGAGSRGGAAPPLRFSSQRNPSDQAVNDCGPAGQAGFGRPAAAPAALGDCTSLEAPPPPPASTPLPPGAAGEGAAHPHGCFWSLLPDGGRRRRHGRCGPGAPQQRQGPAMQRGRRFLFAVARRQRRRRWKQQRQVRQVRQERQQRQQQERQWQARPLASTRRLPVADPGFDPFGPPPGLPLSPLKARRSRRRRRRPRPRPRRPAKRSGASARPAPRRAAGRRRTSRSRAAA
jgi:hypothetical protein